MANKILLIILFVAAGLTLLVYIHDQQSAVQAKSSAVAKLSDPDKHISVSAKRKVPPPPASTDAHGTMQPSAHGTMKRTDHMEQGERAKRVKQTRAHGLAQNIEETKD
eukprot:453422_1